MFRESTNNGSAIGRKRKKPENVDEYSLNNPRNPESCPRHPDTATLARHPRCLLSCTACLLVHEGGGSTKIIITKVEREIRTGVPRNHPSSSSKDASLRFSILHSVSSPLSLCLSLYA